MQDSDWEELITAKLYALVEHLSINFRVERVVIMQILHRLQPLRPVKHPVDIPWFNKRCDQINKIVAALTQDDERLLFWKHKGLFEEDLLNDALGDDGTHLNSAVGYPKDFKNIRAAFVSMKKELL